MTKRYQTNLEISELLRNVSSTYQIKDDEKYKFRIIAYDRAATAIEHLSSEIKDIWDEGKLEEIPGVGPNIAKYLDEIMRTGTSIHFEKIMKGIPESVYELMKVPGIGPKTAMKLSQELGINKSHNALKKLELAIKKGRIKDMEGFGEVSQKAIEKSIHETRKKTRRMLLPYAMNIANEVKEYLQKLNDIESIDVLGSLRRKASTIGDIDFAVSSKNPQKVLKYFCIYPKAKKIIEVGNTKAAIMLPGDIQVDIRVVDPSDYGSLLQHFTGSKNHNIALREYALKKDLSLSEYGIINKTTGVKKHYDNEENFYKALGLSYIPPELREDTGEIDLSAKGEIPNLVELSDIKGDTQIHSNYDIETSHDLGVSTIEEITNTALDKKYEYIALTDHNPSRGNHTDAEILGILKKRKDYIEQYNSSIVKDVKSDEDRVIDLYNSLEIDIMPDGNLSVPDVALDILDFALVSIHSSFRLEKTEMTKRILSALDHPKSKIFAHPTGRLLGNREGIEADWEKIFEYMGKYNKYIEINGDPMRLDLPDYLIKVAKEYNVKFILGTDAHSAEGLNNMQWAIAVARRGGLTAKDIINTYPLEKFDTIIKDKGGEY